MIKASNRLWRRGLSSLSSVRLREIFACSALIGALGLLVGGALPVGAQTNDPYVAAVLADGPVAYYRLNDTGNTAADSSGNTNNLGPIGAAVAKGQPGLLQTDNDTAMLLPGETAATGTIRTPGRIAALEPANALSVEVWVKPAALPTSNWNANAADIVVYGDDDVFAPYGLLIDANGHIVFKLDVGTGTVVTSNATVAVGDTAHVVATFDGKVINLYINGVLDTTQAATGTIKNYGYANRNLGLTVGEDGHFVDPASFNGTVDELAVYDTALSKASVLAHYNAAGMNVSAKAAAKPVAAKTANPEQAGVIVTGNAAPQVLGVSYNAKRGDSSSFRDWPL